MIDKNKTVLNLGRLIIVVLIGVSFGKWMKSVHAGVFMVFASLWIEDCMERAGLITIKSLEGKEGNG